jgi:hypothetical protein
MPDASTRASSARPERRLPMFGAIVVIVIIVLVVMFLRRR